MTNNDRMIGNTTKFNIVYQTTYLIYLDMFVINGSEHEYTHPQSKYRYILYTYVTLTEYRFHAPKHF